MKDKDLIRKLQKKNILLSNKLERKYSNQVSHYNEHINLVDNN